MFEFLKEHVCPVDDKFNDPHWFERFKKQYAIKHEICKQQNPKTIIEIGVRAGYSALAFLTACPDAKYIGIDFERLPEGKIYTEWASNLLKPYDFEIWKLNTQAITFIDKEEIDFFHIDGSHATKSVMHDLDLCFKILSSDGLILLDDMVINNVGMGIRTWIENHESEINYEYIISRTGEMLIRKAGNHEKFYKDK